MAGGVKRNKGNKKMGSWDRLDVPKTDYLAPVFYPITPPEQPTVPVGQRVCVKSVSIFEISPTYEGNPDEPIGTMIKIPIQFIVGCPVSTASLTAGYDFTTEQGEVINIRWYSPLQHAVYTDDFKKYQGVMLTLKSVPNRDPFYDTEWGHVFGVGIEWSAGDGSVKGTSWSNRFAGWSENSSILSSTGYPTVVLNSGDPDKNPVVIRGRLMLGDPVPKRTIEEMGSGLPIQVLPALGKKGNVSVFAFNSNVQDYIQIAPPTIPYATLSGAGTAAADAINGSWQKDDYAVKTRVMLRLTTGSNKVSGANVVSAGANSYWMNNISTARTGSWSGTITLTNGLAVYEIILWEVDDNGSPIRELAGVKRTQYWPDAGSTSEPMEFPPVPDPCGCGMAEVTPPDDGGETPSGEPDSIETIKYFCDNSVDPNAVVSDYWNIPSLGIDTKFWTGFNQLMQAFGYGKLILTPKNFHQFLWLLVKKSKEGKVFATELEKDWQSFLTYTNQGDSGLTCLNSYQKASVWLSYRLKIPVVFYENAKLNQYLEGTRMDSMATYINKTKTFAYDFLSFQDVMTDSASSGVGAFNSDPTPSNAANFPDLKNFKSFVNMEPEGLLFKQALPNLGEVFPANLTDAFKPWDYITTGSSGSSISSPMWSPTNPVANPYNPTYWTDAAMYDQNKDGLIAAQIAVHEMGHALDSYAFDTCGKPLSQFAEWMEITGHTSTVYQTTTHQVRKSRGISQTGGMPLTDDGHEAPVSSYGCMNIQDQFAEAYRFYIFNPKFLQDKHPLQFAFMEKYVKPMTETNVICPVR